MKWLALWLCISIFSQSCSMELSEEQAQAELKSMLENVFNDYLKQESAFRAAAMHLYSNWKKEARLPSTHPLQRVYEHISERITDRMVDLSAGILEERQNEIIAGAIFYCKRKERSEQFQALKRNIACHTKWEKRRKLKATQS